MRSSTVSEQLVKQLESLVPAALIQSGDAINSDVSHDECLTVPAVTPTAVVTPTNTQEVATVLKWADAEGVPITARGAGTGLSGAAIPTTNSVVLSFEKMNKLLEIDEANHTATVQPGLRLNELDELTAARDLVYPVYPGEYSASLGGNIATNAGGMRAVKYGVTRHHVLGLELVLPGGEIMRAGGKYVKASTGYDLTQLVIGSEGTLALVTEATLKLYPRSPFQSTVLAPFNTLDEVTRAVPEVINSGVDPLILEYIDILTMSAAQSYAGLELGIPQEIKDTALAYLVVVLEATDEDRLGADTERLATHLVELGALDAYVLPPNAANDLIDAREKSFWMAKDSGANDVIDVVVPRAQISDFLNQVSGLASQYEAWIAGCGHAGDGNVHLGIFLADDVKRSALMHDLFKLGMDLGGAISGEHGIGQAKQEYFNALEDPNKIALMKRIKAAFDPNGILNPHILFD